MNEEMSEISVGRIVHFVIPSGRCRPSICVEDWHESPQGKPGLCNLVVFPDGSNDGKYGVDDHTHQVPSREQKVRIGGKIPLGNSTRSGIANLPLLTGWETSVHPNHAVRVLRTWHWGRECKNLRQPLAPFIEPETKEIYHHNHVDGMVDPHNCPGCQAQARYIKENIP